MGLFASVLQYLPGQRLIELTNAENPGGLRSTALAGTVTVTGGSPLVVGAGTAFVTGGLAGLVATFGAVVVQFSSQPGVNYVVASVQSDTQLTLSVAYGSVTTAAVNATLPAVVYPLLQQAVFYAEQEFVTRTNFPFDDLTANAAAAGAVTALNKCIWAGISLVTLYLYEARGRAWPEGEIESARRTSETRLKWVLANYGDGAWAQPATDSVLRPSVGPARLPTMDNTRFGDVTPNAPGPSWPSGGGSGVSGWGW